MDFPRASSDYKLLWYLYTLYILHENIKSCNTKNSVKTTRTVKNNNNTGVISKKKNFKHAAHFFVQTGLAVFLRETIRNDDF